MSKSSVPAEAVQSLLDRILNVGIEGAGPLKGAEEIAAEHLKAHGDREKAIDRLIATHTRLVGAAGFATGLGGLITLPLAVPTDLGVFYVQAGRCAAAVAHLRGYDVRTDEVQSMILISLLGASGTQVLHEAGVHAGTKAATSALKKLPGRVLIEINKKVGFRLFTKFGEKGVVNLVKVVPIAGGVVGGGVNVAGMRTIGRYAKKNFPAVEVSS